MVVHSTTTTATAGRGSVGSSSTRRPRGGVLVVVADVVLTTRFSVRASLRGVRGRKKLEMDDGHTHCKSKPPLVLRVIWCEAYKAWQTHNAFIVGKSGHFVFLSCGMAPLLKSFEVFFFFFLLWKRVTLSFWPNSCYCLIAAFA